MRTRMSGGVGAGRANLPATRLPGYPISWKLIASWFYKLQTFSFLTLRIGVTLLSIAASSCTSKPGRQGVVGWPGQPVALASPAIAPNASRTVTDSPVIVHLASRDNIITISSGPNGAVYSVTDKQGHVLHRDLSGKELQAKAPDLYRVITNAIGANGGAKANDARVRVGSKR